MGLIKVFFQPGSNPGAGVAQLTAITQTLLCILPPGISPPPIIRYLASNVPIAQTSLSSETLGESDLFDASNAFIRPGLAVGFPNARLDRQHSLDLTRVADNYTYYVGVGVSIPVFNGGRNRANEQVACSESEALVADYRQAALVAFQEVETSQADVRQAQAAARQRAYRLASALPKELYRAGLTNYFEVVDADRQTLDAATLLTQAQSSLLGAGVALVRALGGGWEQELNLQISYRFKNTCQAAEDFFIL